MGLKIALVQEKRTFALFHIPWKRWVKREKKGANFFWFPPPQTPICSARLAKQVRSVPGRQGRRGQILHSAWFLRSLCT